MSARKSSGDWLELDEADVWGNINTTDDAAKTPAVSRQHPFRKLVRKTDKVDEHEHHHHHHHHRQSVPVKGWGVRSLPVNIPDWSKILGREQQCRDKVEEEEEEEEDEEDENERLPPHEYLARTRVASMSVQQGVGRTLKGRDLSRVRNAIWKHTTGFQD